MDAAKATLSQVVKRYPGSDPARVADDQLRAMQLSQVR
jgi:TolA-binding protein